MSFKLSFKLSFNLRMILPDIWTISDSVVSNTPDMYWPTRTEWHGGRQGL